MYSGPWLEQTDLEFIDWPLEYIPNSIPDLAEYIVNNLCVEYNSVIGSSLGGMVALEVAKLLKLPQAFLLGSAVSHSEVNSFLLKITPFANITPLSLCKSLAGKSNALLPQMYSQQNPSFIRSMAKAIPGWEFSGNVEPIRIHGSRDHVIHCSNPHITLDTGHLIAITHPIECISSIRQLTRRWSGS